MSTYTPDEMLVVLGFTVTIDGAGSGGDVDSAWETCSGGGLNIEVSDASTGTDQSHATTPGHKYVDTITLRGPMTAGRTWIARQLLAQTRDPEARFTLKLTEVLRGGRPGRTFIYHDCFITRYRFPSLNAAEKGDLYEEVHIKPIRLELA